jgi:phage-related holin
MGELETNKKNVHRFKQSFVVSKIKSLMIVFVFCKCKYTSSILVIGNTIECPTGHVDAKAVKVLESSSVF